MPPKTIKETLISTNIQVVTVKSYKTLKQTDISFTIKIVKVTLGKLMTMNNILYSQKVRYIPQKLYRHVFSYCFVMVPFWRQYLFILCIS